MVHVIPSKLGELLGDVTFAPDPSSGIRTAGEPWGKICVQSFKSEIKKRSKASTLVRLLCSSRRAAHVNVKLIHSCHIVSNLAQHPEGSVVYKTLV
jgi:hypothetical protein